MVEYRIRNFGELHEALGNHRHDAGWIYRGHADPDWPLVPRAGRAPINGRPDEVFFRRWKQEALQFDDISPEDDWSWLAIAQHHGFATRLLDWTMQPLAAAWFAVCEPGDGDSVVWAFRTSSILADQRRESPFERQGITQFVPAKVCPRVSRQIGIFTHHSPPHLDLRKGMAQTDRLERFIIDASYRDNLEYELNQYGVNAQSLFPNMVGLSRHFNWIMASFDYWRGGPNGMGDSN